jgi:hypothetical protein
MRSGRGVEFYDSPYWQRRGQPRFFRYLKSAIPTSSASVRNANLHATGPGKGQSSDPVTADEHLAPRSGISSARPATDTSTPRRSAGESARSAVRADRTKAVEISKMTPPAVSSPVDTSPGATSHDSGKLTTADSQSSDSQRTKHNLSRPEGVWEKTATKPSAGIPFASEAAPAQVHAPQSRQGLAASNSASAGHPVARRRSEDSPQANESMPEPPQMAMSKTVPRPPWSSASRSNSASPVPRPPAGWVPHANPGTGN